MAEFFFGHVGAAQNPLSLKPGRRRHHDHCVAQPLAAGLEKQGNVEAYQRRAAPGVTSDESLRFATYPRMQDRLQAPQGGGISKHPGAELAPVDAACDDDTRKGGIDRRHCSAAAGHQAMHGRVGVVHRHAEAPQHIRRRRLAHTDRAGQAQDTGPAPTSTPFHFEARTNLRKAGVTLGSMPNQLAKPGAAWCSSMPRPSTVGLPRAAAAASRAVSSGA